MIRLVRVVAAGIAAAFSIYQIAQYVHEIKLRRVR